MQKLAKKTAHLEKMKTKYNAWHARADCTGVVPKKTDTATAQTKESKETGYDTHLDPKKHPPLETGVMRLLVVSRHTNFCNFVHIIHADDQPS